MVIRLRKTRRQGFLVSRPKCSGKLVSPELLLFAHIFFSLTAVSHAINSRVIKPDTNTCINKAIHMLLMHSFLTITNIDVINSTMHSNEHNLGMSG